MDLTWKPNVVISDEEDTLREFIGSFGDDYESFELVVSVNIIM